MSPLTRQQQVKPGDNTSSYTIGGNLPMIFDVLSNSSHITFIRARHLRTASQSGSGLNYAGRRALIRCQAGMNRNPILNIRRLACTLTGLAIAALAFAATGPAPLAAPLPAPGTGGPATVAHHLATIHTAAVGGTPGWQITLIAVAAAVLAATLAVRADRALAARRQATATAT